MNHNSIMCANQQAKRFINARGEFEFWRADGYHAYLMAHGEHLSPKLAEYASSCLENHDGSNHCWTKEEVISALKSAKVEIPICMTHADVHYLANKTYAKYIGGYCKDDLAVLELVKYKLKIKSRKGDMTFNKLMLGYMKHGHSIDFCKVI